MIFFILSVCLNNMSVFLWVLLGDFFYVGVFLRILFCLYCIFRFVCAAGFDIRIRRRFIRRWLLGLRWRVEFG